MGGTSLSQGTTAVSERITINYFDGKNYSDVRHRTIRHRLYFK
jgi:hypothetical protein